MTSPSHSSRPSTLTRLVAGSTRRLDAPHTAGRPAPRATTAACEASPPPVVTTAAAASRPGTSAGVVSVITRMVGTPSAARSRASRLDSEIRPLAAPGEAASPRTSSGSPPRSRNWGCSSACTCSGRTERTAVAFSRVPAWTRSTASRTVAWGLGWLSGAALSSASSPSFSSNPTCATVRKWCSRVASASRRRSAPPGSCASGSPGPLGGSLRRTPRWNTPLGANAPVSGSRLAALPWPERAHGPISSACRWRAIGVSAGSDCAVRARRPRGEFHRASVAVAASATCSAGSCG